MVRPGDHSNASWSSLPPGTVLDAVLETFTPRSLEDRELVDATVGCERQVAHLYALQVRMIAELRARTGPGGHAATVDAVGAALRLDMVDAAQRVSFAVDLVENLPATLSALDGGRIGLAKAMIIAERTRRLAPATRAAVEGVAVGRAPDLNHQQLGRWLDDALSSSGGGGTASSSDGA